MNNLTDQIVQELTSKKALSFIVPIEDVFKNTPRLPKGLVTFFVSVAPWLAGLAAILGFISGLNQLFHGLGVSTTAWMQLIGYSPVYFLLSGILQLVSAVLLFLAFTRLRQKALSGWMLLFWNATVGAAQTVLGLAFSMGGNLGIGTMLWSLFWLAITFYILFEMKNEYSQ